MLSKVMLTVNAGTFSTILSYWWLILIAVLVIVLATNKNLRRTMGSNLGVVGEFLGFLMRQKQYWLIPMVVVLLAFAVFIIFGTASGLAPFIYTLF